MLERHKGSERSTEAPFFRVEAKKTFSFLGIYYVENHGSQTDSHWW